MDISDVPRGGLGILVEAHLVFVYAPRQDPLILSTAQVETLWRATVARRGRLTGEALTGLQVAEQGGGASGVRPL